MPINAPKLFATMATAVLLFSSFITSAQYAEITWQRRHGSSTVKEIGRDISIGQNGGFVMVGRVSSSVSRVVKTDDSGYVEWQKDYGGVADFLMSIKATNDGGYVAAGQKDYNFWLLKLDDTGAVEWEQTYGGNIGETAFTVEQTGDGGYVLCGWTNSTGLPGYHGGQYDGYVVKLDSVGNVQWQKTYGGSSWDVLQAIHQTSDGGFIMAVETLSDDGDVTHFNMGSYDYWIVKTDSAGNITWEESYGGSMEDRPSEIIETSDGNYIISGTTRSANNDVSNQHGSGDIWVLKISATGSVLWEETYGAWLGDGWGQMLQKITIKETTPGNYTVTGSTNKYDTPDGDLLCPVTEKLRGWIFNIDNSGSMNWQKQFRGEPGGVVRTNDGGYVVGGWIDDKSFLFTETGDFFIARFDTTSVFNCDVELLGVNEVDGAAAAIQVYPTISKGIVHVELPQGFENAEISLFDMVGKSVKTTHSNSRGLGQEISLDGLVPSVYILVVSYEGSKQTFKVIYQP